MPSMISRADWAKLWEVDDFEVDTTLWQCWFYDEVQFLRRHAEEHPIMLTIRIAPMESQRREHLPQAIPTLTFSSSINTIYVAVQAVLSICTTTGIDVDFLDPTHYESQMHSSYVIFRMDLAGRDLTATEYLMKIRHLAGEGSRYSCTSAFSAERPHILLDFTEKPPAVWYELPAFGYELLHLHSERFASTVTAEKAPRPAHPPPSLASLNWIGGLYEERCAYKLL